MRKQHATQTDESPPGKRRRKRKRKPCCRSSGQSACKRLSELDNGETGTIECVECPARKRLQSMGVRPGKRIEVCTKHPFDGPVVIAVGRSTVSLSRSQARDLEVTVDG